MAVACGADAGEAADGGGAALVQYETCRRLLSDELGVEPSADTVALYASIVGEKVALLPSPSAPPAFLDPRAQPATAVPSALFVAREAELAQLDSYLGAAAAGRGQVVFITGEPGCGKSMLYQEFSRHAQNSRPQLVVIRGSCNAYTGAGDPYLPFLELLGMLAGDIEMEWDAGAIEGEHARRLWRLLPDVMQALLNDGPDLIDRFVSGAGLLARIRSGAPSHVQKLEALLKQKAASPGAPSGQQIDLFEQYTKVLQRVARNHLLLLILDDLQWADAGSIGLLFHLGKRLPGHRILLLGAYRSGEVASGREGKRHPLEPVVNELRRDYGDNQVDLSKVEGRRWIDALLDSEPNRLGQSFRSTLLRHTNGHALFTVELLRGLQKRGDLICDETGYWLEGPSLDWDTLPPRVEAVIAESIGRLPQESQAILSVASVEGEVFTAEAVARVLRRDEQETIQSLSGHLGQQQRLVIPAGVQRVDSGLISRYRFRHFLFQKYLYSRLEEAESAHLHQAVGEALENLLGEQSPEMAAQLARHFEMARLFPKAVQYLGLAAERASRISANAEAIAYYERAIGLLQNLPASPERAAAELRLRVALGVPLLALSGYTSQEIEANYTQARELTKGMQPSPELFWTLFGIQTYCNLALILPEARPLGDQMLALAADLQDDLLLMVASQARSITALYEGDFDTYKRYADQVARLYDRSRHREMAYLAGLDLEVGRLCHAAWGYWSMGYPDQAARYAQAACDWADQIQHPFTTAFAYGLSGKMYVFQRSYGQAQPFVDRALAVAEEFHLVTWLGANRGGRGILLVEQGQLAEGLSLLEWASANLQAAGDGLIRVMQGPELANAYGRAGRTTEGLALIDEFLQFITSVGYRLTAPDFHATKGDLLLRQAGDERVAEAEMCYWQALDMAHGMGAKSWELRAALKLARLWQRQGKDDDAYGLLAPLYGWFTEGFDTPDLVEARVLLEALASH